MEHLVLNSPADQLVAVQTYIATVVTLLLLAAAYLGELDLAKPDLATTITQLAPWVTECVAASQSWPEFVDLTTPLYLLSRGSGLASVDEGVLLMHEVAKTPATGMSVAQFRHGFVEAADERIRAVVIGTQPATSAIDQQFAVDLTRMGAAVRWIGPLDAGSSLQGLGAWPQSVPARFASVFEAVPLQLLAYRTAESRGLVPGLFRWASTVTGSESGFPGLSDKAK
jgi:glutamine---fructose-6-phosphate transaminase (isomerizing)